MITEQYVSFETARLLKEVGFNAHCSFIIDDDGNKLYRPTQELAASWIRENHNIHISIEPYANTWRWILWWTNGVLITNSATAEKRDFETYEQAMEDAIRQALRRIIKNKER